MEIYKCVVGKYKKKTNKMTTSKFRRFWFPTIYTNCFLITIVTIIVKMLQTFFEKKRFNY